MKCTIHSNKLDCASALYEQAVERRRLAVIARDEASYQLRQRQKDLDYYQDELDTAESEVDVALIKLQNLEKKANAKNKRLPKSPR